MIAVDHQLNVERNRIHTIQGHKVYQAIIKAIRTGKLSEPFTVLDFQNHCPGFGNGTYNAFLYKHRRGNPGGNSELFDKIAPGLFNCLRPLKYGL